MTLESAGSVSGNLLNPDGTTPAETAYITLKGSNFTKYGSADSSGNFLFNAVKLGNFSVEIQGIDNSGKARVFGQLAAHKDTVNFDDMVLDNVYPEVIDVSPAHGSTLVPLNPVVTVSFSEEMGASSINNSTVKLTSNWGNTAGGSVLSADSKSVVFTPSAPLRSFALYTLIVGATVEDAAGNELGTTFTASFTTSDIEPPVVVSMVPTNNATGILTEAVITVFFNEPVDPPQFNGGNMVVTNTIGGAAVTGTTSFNEGNMSVVFTPVALETDSTYAVLVRQAVDFAGNVQSVPFNAAFSTKDTIAPTLQLVPPAGGTSVIEGGAVQVSADTGTSTDISAVHFFINGELKYTDHTAPYRFQFIAPLINQTSGSTFLLDAYAVDHEGNQGTRADITFTLLPDSPPQVTLSGPPDTIVYPGGTISCSVSASDDILLTRITITAAGGALNYLDTQSVSQSSFSKNYLINVPPDILPGTAILLRAEAEDSRGSTVSADDVMINVPQDEQDPVVNITSPSEGARFGHNEVINIEAQASDDVGIKEVRMYLDDQLRTTHTQEPYTASYTVPPLEEEKQSVVKVEAEDLSGKVSQDTVNIVIEQLIDITAPKVKILSPSDGSLVFPGENLKIKVDATDDEGVDRVEIYIDNQLFRTDTEDPFETNYTIPADAAPGTTITFKAVAVDVDNKSTTDQSIVEVVTGTILPDGTIIETDNIDYENQVIIINDGTVTINGAHTFTHVLVKESGILTYKGATIDEEYRMELTITGKLVIGIDAKISADSRGYLGAYQDGNSSYYGRTLGNTNTGGSNKPSGGSYGGYGGIGSNSTVNEVYGSIYNPSNPGSGGGGNSSYHGGSGGGAIIIDINELVNDGGIFCNGGNASNAGAGSGGSIYIKMNTLKGGGAITADGGNSGNCAGGGGRIALYYEDASEFDLSKITAYGGTTSSNSFPGRNGSAGSIYLEKQGEPGQIIINNNNTETQKATPLTAAAPGTITALTGTVLTDKYADFVPNSLVGMVLLPNIDRTEAFTIISNTFTEIEVETTGMILTQVAKVGDHYRVKHPANLLLEDGDTHINGNVNVSSITLVNTTLTLDGTLTVDGQLSLQSGSRITHSTATIDSIYTLQIEADEIVLDESSSIDVKGRGYLGGHQDTNNSDYGRTLDNTNTGGSNKPSGGSYGGYGGIGSNSTVNEVYGSIYNPSDPGSGGGGNSSYHGGSGGGVIIIDTNELVNDGGIFCNGGNASNAGAGSGGSIYIKVNTLKGGGTITAHGGNSGNGAGGAGRIALYYENASEFDLSKITAYGGTTSNDNFPGINGSSGTIYLKKNNEEGKLIIDNRGNHSSNYLIFPAIGPSTITEVSANVLTDSNASFMPGSLIGMKLIPDINNKETNFVIIVNTRTTITVDGDLATAAVGDTYCGIFVFPGHLIIKNTYIAEISGDAELGNLSILEDARLYHPASTADTTYYLSLKVPEKINIDSTSCIIADSRGYPGGYQDGNISYYGRTLGNTNTGASFKTSGGSYGGYGGIENNNPVNEVYGSIYNPSDPGSGGGGRGLSYPGRNGGGVIGIDVGELVNNGGIYSNGGNAGNSASAGSGGSIYIKANTLKGGGTITANGGNSGYGAGGGGRIAVYYENASEFDLTKITAYGGTNNASYPDRNGGAGTIYLKKSTAAYGDLIIDNNNSLSRADSTTLPAVGQGFNTMLQANKMENNAAPFIPGALIGIKLNPQPTVNTVFTIISNTGTEIFTDPADGDMTQISGTGGPYIGEHYLFNLTIKGSAQVFTLDRIQVTGTLTIEPGSLLKAENHQ